MDRTNYFAKVTKDGTVLEVGQAIKLGHGTGETLRNSASQEMADGVQILRVLLADDLGELAASIVSNVMQEGAKTHKPGTWRTHDVSYHLKHALTHLRAAIKGELTDEHLWHTIARVVLAVALQNLRSNGTIVV